MLVALASFDIACRTHGLRLGRDCDWDEEDFASCAFDVPAETAALSEIAALIEMNLPDTFTVCAYCAGRFNAGSTNNCPHCGAAL